MAVIDRKRVLERIAELPRVDLELGCGTTKRTPSHLGVDELDLPGVDLVGDVFEVLAAFPDESVDSVSSFHFFEHVEDLPRLLGDIARVMKPGGALAVVAPHFSNPYFYSDYTHRRFFGLYTLCYFAKSDLFSRQVPTYGIEPQFELVDVRLVFKSTRPFYVRHAIKRTLGWFINTSNYTREFYEENLCYLVPCYEIAYSLKRI
jgi:SAM-dependent methyltransferase